MKYDLSNMVARKPGTTALVPIIEPPAALEKAILAQLRRVGQEAARGFREIILPAYQRKLIRDAEESDWERFKLLIRAMIRAAADQVSQLLRLEGRRHTKAWMTSARKAFGIDLSSVVKEEDLEAYLEQAALRNASLISGLGDDLIKRVQMETTNALIAGESASSLQERIRKQLGISDNRARLIARDQTSKLTSDLNRVRHQQAGIEEYIWRTSHDERVRERHRKLEGLRYKYGEPTGAEDGLPPGQPIQCRCVAQAVVTFGEPSTRTPPPSVEPPFDYNKAQAEFKSSDDPIYRARNDLSDNEKASIRNYQGRQYLTVNSYLLGDRDAIVRDPYLVDTIEALDGAIAKSKVPEIPLYRGMTLNREQIKAVLDAGELHHTNFVSMTSKPSTARGFGMGMEGERVFIRTKLKKTKALYLDTVENEYILPRGTKFKVTQSKEMDLDGKTFLVLDVEERE